MTHKNNTQNIKESFATLGIQNCLEILVYIAQEQPISLKNIGFEFVYLDKNLAKYVNRLLNAELIREAQKGKYSLNRGRLKIMEEYLERIFPTPQASLLLHALSPNKSLSYEIKAITHQSTADVYTFIRDSRNQDELGYVSLADFHIYNLQEAISALRMAGLIAMFKAENQQKLYKSTDAGLPYLAAVLQHLGATNVEPQ